jgi:hypothetical protein
MVDKNGVVDTNKITKPPTEHWRKIQKELAVVMEIDVSDFMNSILEYSKKNQNLLDKVKSMKSLQNYAFFFEEYMESSDSVSGLNDCRSLISVSNYYVMQKYSKLNKIELKELKLRMTT